MDNVVRGIADYFLTCRDRRDVDPTAIKPALLPYVYVLRVESAASAATPRLRVVLTGTKLDNAFGRAMNGRFLESFLHGPHGVDVVAGYRRCAETHQPIWMRQVARIYDRPPRYVEGAAIYLNPGYIYGGMVMGEAAAPFETAQFQQAFLR
jgi:hypothetical protein